MLFLGLYGFLLLLLIPFLGFLQTFGFRLHGDQCHGNTGKQGRNQHIGIGKHGPVEHLLRFLNQQEPVVMQRLRSHRPAFHGRDCHDGGPVHTIRADKPEQDTAETFVMLHHVGNTGKRGVDDTFRLLPDFIEHH